MRGTVGEAVRNFIGDDQESPAAGGAEGVLDARTKAEEALGSTYKSFEGSDEYWGWVVWYHAGVDLWTEAGGEETDGPVDGVRARTGEAAGSAVVAALRKEVSRSLEEMRESGDRTTGPDELAGSNQLGAKWGSTGPRNQGRSTPGLAQSGSSTSAGGAIPPRTPTRPASAPPIRPPSVPVGIDAMQDLQDRLDRVLLELEVIERGMEGIPNSVKDGACIDEELALLKDLKDAVRFEIGDLCVERDKCEVARAGAELVPVSWRFEIECFWESTDLCLGSW
ncbi:hypothetical protein M427DRAFT_306471 [Gonapodya prolifera JEL478]|uniref:Uncharacterized protein n=1 Tax=Gonapodya prolifera (strain JEL478) TaxID=1344416 RepID=A0A139AGN8_GONPJ|nr:hypothetical protein M427DRAFT_306471 [Gonapodya prolifera JEL478]|eukprot:KXS15966.1 hypothetical protein M427DRAFT_306471 [Gonapodya prolifera JEL478]